MEDLEGFLMDEGPDLLPGCLELESSFSSSFESWWNGQMISEFDACDLDLFSLLEEGSSAHQQHSFSIGSTYQNEEQLKLQPRQPEQQEEEEQQQQKEGDGFLESDSFDSELFSLLEENESTLRPSSSVVSINQIEQEKQQQQPSQQRPQSSDDEEEEEEDSNGNDKTGNAPNSKNMLSERNRRKRLNQQLFTLRSLVPNITKMAKKSILSDALAYLQSILQQIEKEKENANVAVESSCDDSFLIVEEEIPPMQTQEYILCDSPPAISEMEVEIFDEERFLLKISCNRAMGALSQVQRVIGSLGLEITCTSINQLNHDHILTTAFLRVKKKGIVTEEKLKKRAKTMAFKLGLLLPNPDGLLKPDV